MAWFEAAIAGPDDPTSEGFIWGDRRRQDFRGFGPAMQRPLIALIAVLFAATGCGGGGDGVGTQIRLSEFAPTGVREETETRWLHGTCPSGRLAVDFRPGEEITISNNDRLVASLSATQARIDCPGAQLVLAGEPSGWGFRRFSGNLKRPTTLVCPTDEPIDIFVFALYEYEASLVGGAIIVSIPAGSSSPQALLFSGFRESGDSWFSYHTPRCRRR